MLDLNVKQQKITSQTDHFQMAPRLFTQDYTFLETHSSSLVNVGWMQGRGRDAGLLVEGGAAGRLAAGR